MSESMSHAEAVEVLRRLAPNGWKATPGGSVTPIIEDVCDWQAFWFGSRQAMGEPAEALVVVLNAVLARAGGAREGTP